MKNSNLKKISTDNMRGWMYGEVLDILPHTFFKDPFTSIQTMGEKILKESTWRRAALFTLPDGRRIFIKKDKTKGPAESLKYLFYPSKGRKEFMIASRLAGKDLNLPQPLGWMERVGGGCVKESYYVSEAVGTGLAFIDEVNITKAPWAIQTLADTVNKFQDAGLLHQDLHGGNFLWRGKTLFLTDLHHAKMVKTLSMRQRFWNLSHLFHSLRATWRESEELQFLDCYFDRRVPRNPCPSGQGPRLAARQEGVQYNENTVPESSALKGGELYKRFNDSQIRDILYRHIHPVMQRLQKRQWQSRTKRCLKNSSEFTIHQEKGVRYFSRRDFPMERLKRLVQQHRDLSEKDPASLAKNAPEVKVSVIQDEGVCLKQFCYPDWIGRFKEYFRRSKGRKAWVAANGLRARGIPSLQPLALVERKKRTGLRESIFLMEAMGKGLEMDRYLLKGFSDLKEKRRFIRTFARWLDTLHQRSLYHKDMKTCNIVVLQEGETWGFRLLDLEDLMMNQTLNLKKLFRNLLQLNTSTPRMMTRTDRLRFFKEYLRLHPVAGDLKAFLRRLVNESRRRGLVYVSPQGVVQEAM